MVGTEPPANQLTELTVLLETVEKGDDKKSVFIELEKTDDITLRYPQRCRTQAAENLLICGLFLCSPVCSYLMYHMIQVLNRLLV